MKKLVQLSALIIAFVLTANITKAQDIISAKDYAVLAKKDKNVVTVFAGKEKNYKANHIKGSILVSYKDAIKEGDPKGLMLEAEGLAKFFGDKGISDQNTIIVYDNGSQKYSSRVYWLLKYLGAPNVKILHKDYDQWRKARIMVTSAPAKGKATTFTANVKPAMLANITDVKSSITDPNVILIDNRKSEEFSGADSKSPGHIKGSINLFWEDLVTDTKAFKSKEELQAVAKATGITPDKEIIFYCNTGILAAVGYVAFVEILEYPNVKLYEGAMEEWKATASNPIEK